MDLTRRFALDTFKNFLEYRLLSETDNPSFFYYDNAFLAFGGNFETIYTSEAGIAWYKANKKIFLPAEFKDRGNNYSTVVDKNNFIWVIWSNGGANEVWRGRLNKFGFESQNNN